MLIIPFHSTVLRLLVVAGIPFNLAGTTDGKTADEIRSFTDSRTRVLWVQDMGKGSDEHCEKSNSRLMGIDTDDGKGEHPILAKISNYYRPLITRGGDKIVFTDWIKKRIYSVNWDGTQLHEIATGIAEAVWRDPVDGTDWVYARTGLDKKRQPGGGTLVERIQVNQPKNRKTVWNNSSIPIDQFQVSADGLRAAASTPWPRNSLVNLADGTIDRPLNNGCWPSLSPDNSYRCWVFDGSHRWVDMYQPDKEDSWKVVINNHPTLAKHEVYHPRWTNHPRFIAVSGPYNKIHQGGTQVDVYLGKFDADYRSIEKWIPLHVSDRGNFYPEVWIESAFLTPPKAYAGPITKNKPPVPAGKQPVAPESAKLSAIEPIFGWESGNKEGFVKDARIGQTIPATPESRGMALFGRNREMIVTNGSFTVPAADEPLTSAITLSNKLSIEAVIIPEQAKATHQSRIITFSSTSRSRNFSLSQEGEYLVFRIRTTETGPNATKGEIRLCKLKAGQPNHVIVTYESGRVVCYLNSKKVRDGKGPKGDLSNWGEQNLVLGDEWQEGKADWHGRLESTTIYDRVLSLTEACERYDSFVAKVRNRKPVQQVVVLAKILTITSTPTPEAVAPYRRVLVVSDCEVEKVLSGQLADQKFQVTRWGMLDARVLPSDWKVGSVQKLTLEKFSDQPQLIGERVVSDSSEFGLGLYHAVAMEQTDAR